MGARELRARGASGRRERAGGVSGLRPALLAAKLGAARLLPGRQQLCERGSGLAPPGKERSRLRALPGCSLLRPSGSPFAG